MATRFSMAEALPPQVWNGMSIEGNIMKMRICKAFILLNIGIALTGCTCLSDWCLGKETYQKFKNPKAYGEYWTKPGMTKESWREDWVACGGMSNGQYSGGAPEGSSTKVMLEYQTKERKKLDACMQSKGYEYHYTGIGASPKKTEKK